MCYQNVSGFCSGCFRGVRRPSQRARWRYSVARAVTTSAVAVTVLSASSIGAVAGPRAGPLAVKTFMSSGDVLAPALVTNRRRNSTQMSHLATRCVCRQVGSYVPAGLVVNGRRGDHTNMQRTANASNCLSARSILDVIRCGIMPAPTCDYSIQLWSLFHRQCYFPSERGLPLLIFNEIRQL